MHPDAPPHRFRTALSTLSRLLPRTPAKPEMPPFTPPFAQRPPPPAPPPNTFPPCPPALDALPPMYSPVAGFPAGFPARGLPPPPPPSQPPWSVRLPPAHAPAPARASRRRRAPGRHAQASLQGIRRPRVRRVVRVLNLAQAPATWYGTLAIAGGAGVVEIPVAAFAYTLRSKPGFDGGLPSVLRLGGDTVRRFGDVVDAAAGGGFLIRLSPVDDYGQTAVNGVFTGFVREALLGGVVHRVVVEGGSVLLFPLMFPHVGLCFVGIFVGSSKARAGT